MKVHHITFLASVHATESDDRVRTALFLFLFDNKINEILTVGHFGNPILLLQGKIKGKYCMRFFDILKSNLQENELKKLKNECCERVNDDCIFHIRFDKQAAYNGIVKLAETSDSITAKIKVKVYPAKRENAIKAVETIFQ